MKIDVRVFRQETDPLELYLNDCKIPKELWSNVEFWEDFRIGSYYGHCDFRCTVDTEVPSTYDFYLYEYYHAGKFGGSYRIVDEYQRKLHAETIATYRAYLKYAMTEQFKKFIDSNSSLVDDFLKLDKNNQLILLYTNINL